MRDFSEFPANCSPPPPFIKYRICMWKMFWSIAFQRIFDKTQNICTLNMFTFDVVSVCHSLGQLVKGRLVNILTYISGIISFHRKFYTIQNLFTNPLHTKYVHVWCVFRLSLIRSVSQKYSLVNILTYISGIISFHRKFYTIQNLSVCHDPCL